MQLASVQECHPKVLYALSKAAVTQLCSIRRHTKVRVNKLFNWKALSKVVYAPMPYRNYWAKVRQLERDWGSQVEPLASLIKTLTEKKNAQPTSIVRNLTSVASKSKVVRQVPGALENSVDSACKTVVIYTDGACPKNPGRGGYACVLLYKEHRKEFSGGYRRTTNNRMEMMSAIVALRALKQRCSVLVYSDSKYLVNGVMKGWAKRWQTNNWMRNELEPAVNPDLWAELLSLCARHDVNFKWIPGHRGYKENERCDRLAGKAARSKDLDVDHAYEQKGQYHSSKDEKSIPSMNRLNSADAFSEAHCNVAIGLRI